MLDFEGSDDEFQDTYMATFSVTYSDMFVMVQSTDLKENGDRIPVTLQNRQVCILYTCRVLSTGGWGKVLPQTPHLPPPKALNKKFTQSAVRIYTERRPNT